MHFSNAFNWAPSLVALIYIWVLLLECPPSSHALCPGGCSGHGKCQINDKCDCFSGWGSDSDIADYKANDCSLRTCPADRSWGRYMEIRNNSHVHIPIVECSGRGKCDRMTGECECNLGFTGNACQRTKCFNDCSGHGYCVSMNKMARSKNAEPVGGSYTYGEFPTTPGERETKATWDAEKIFGCVCESSWPVGLASGETQVPEWFGPDCSLRRCPSNDDPITTLDQYTGAPIIETDCSGRSSPGVKGVGAPGNLCHVSCSNRGVCNHKTGTCQCFKGHHGLDCSIVSVDNMILTTTTTVRGSATGSNAQEALYDDQL